MILENISWDSKGDSVGRNAFAYICYPNHAFLKYSIMQCVKQRDDTFVQFYRYPNEGADTISRDHVGAIILALYINRDNEELDWVLENLPWRLSRKYTQTIDFWLWHKSLKSRVYGNLFLLLTMLMFIFVVPSNFLIRKIAGIKKLKYTDFPNNNPIKSKILKLIYPQFALFLLAWQIKTVKDSWLKWLVQKLLLLDSGNVVIDAILGKKITKEKYDEFIQLTSFVWSRRMDTSDDVYITPMKMDCNDLNVAMLDYLYFGIDEIMLKYDDKIINLIKQTKPIWT